MKIFKKRKKMQEYYGKMTKISSKRNLLRIFIQERRMISKEKHRQAGEDLSVPIS